MKITSIAKKIIVALLGAFLLVFLLFHACANLLILANDDGSAYRAFCHFMSSGVIQVIGFGLVCLLLLHVLITVYLWWENKKKRPTNYHVPSRTRTAKGSKFMILTGALIFLFLLLHFCNFYFVGLGMVKGTYTTKLESIQTEEVITLQQATSQFQTDPETFLTQYEQQLSLMKGQMEEKQFNELKTQVDGMRRALPILKFMDKIGTEDMISSDHKNIIRISAEDRDMLQKALPGIEIEADHYYMARQLFKQPLYVLVYLLCFVVLWFHMRHAFESAFQTLGLNNYKYYRAIEIIGIIFAWAICLAFAIIPIAILLA